MLSTLLLENKNTHLNIKNKTSLVSCYCLTVNVYKMCPKAGIKNNDVYYIPDQFLQHLFNSYICNFNEKYYNNCDSNINYNHTESKHVVRKKSLL